MNRLIGRKYIMVKGIDAAAELAKTIAENDYQVVFYENEEMVMYGLFLGVILLTEMLFVS